MLYEVITLRFCSQDLTTSMLSLCLLPLYGLDSVITSYSIHYTKLYDLFPEKLSTNPQKMWSKVEESGYFFLASVFTQQFEQYGTIRITSYNVCYTKLLRNPSFSIYVRQRSYPSREEVNLSLSTNFLNAQQKETQPAKSGRSNDLLDEI